MISLSAKVTGLIVTASMGLFLTAVAILFVVPLVQAIVERRRPDPPDLPAVFENLGIALAIAGFAFRVTEAAAIGVALALLGAAYGYGRRNIRANSATNNTIHPILQKSMLVCGVLCLGVLGEYYFLLS